MAEFTKIDQEPRPIYINLTGERLVFLVVALFSFAFVLSASTLALESEKATTTVATSGLTLAPSDADIYVGGMNLATQWKRFQATQLYYEIGQNRLVKSLVTRWQGEWDAREGQVGQLRSTLQNPNIQSLLEMGADMISEEIFFFTDGQLSEMALQISELADEVTAIAADEENAAENLEEFFMSLPKSEIDEIPVPLLIQGFKVSDTDRVLDKIDQLEGLIRIGLGSIPDAAPFAEGLERIEDAKGTRLSWTIDSEMIPWETLGGANPDVTEKIHDLLDGRQFCLTIGMLNNYLIIAFSESPEEVSELGEEESLLSHADLKPVSDLKTKMVTGVSYLSDNYSDVSFQTNLKNFFSKNSRTFLSQIEKTVEGDLLETLEKLPEDLAWVDDTIDDLIPQFKGQTAVSYFTDTGSESLVYNRTEDVVFDALKSLPILNHVGKDPIAFLTLRLQDHPEYFATSRKIVQKAKGYISAYLESEYADEEQREKGKFFMENGWPLLVQLADLWEQKFLPAMKDGQHAFVLNSGNLINNQWWKDMPPSKTPLALPELATVTGITSKAAMTDAYAELFAWFDRVVEVVRTSEPNSVPAGYQVPRPNESKTAEGDRYAYPIPADCPVPQTMSPQAIFTEQFMVSSYSDIQASALIANQKLAIASPLLKADEPKATAAYIHLGKLSQLALPWIVYGFELQPEALNTVLVPEEGSSPEIKAQDVVDLWKTLGSLGEIASTTVAGDRRGTITKAQMSMPMHK